MKDTTFERSITLVLAADAHDFERWCREHDLSPHSLNVVYASSPRKVDGMRGFGVVRTTRWRLHPNSAVIARVVERNQRKQGSQPGA